MARCGVLVLVVVVAGCYEPPREACSILCTPGAADACPSDMTCEGGYCVAPGGVCTTALAKVRTGGRHVCGLDATGRALCWGDGHEGQLGVAAINDFVATPTYVGDTTWLALATGNEHTCAIKSDHTVWCWGQNDEGESRGVHGGIANVPAQVAGPPTMPMFDVITAGGAHSCAVGEGQLWCWGHQDSLGITTATNAMTRFAPTIGDFIDVAAGTDHTCAISSSMGVLCFGANDAGQAGQPPNAPGSVTTPTVVNEGLPPNLFPLHVTTGNSKTCVLMGDAPDAVSGVVWCWGYNQYKDLGGGNTPVAPAKQLVPDAGWTQISAGAQTICGVRDHQAYCWGTETLGGLGDGVWKLVRTPSQAVALGPADEVFVSSQTPTAPDRGYDELGCLRDGDHVKCWGGNVFGDLGTGLAALRPTPIEIAPPNGQAWQHVWTSDDHTCGQTSDGALWCWGADTLGGISAELGHGTVDQPCTPTAPCDFPRPTAAPSRVNHPESVAIGLAFTCALEAGAITCWGKPDTGVLGAARNTPGVNTVTPPAGQQWDRLYGGNVASCGRTTGGLVSCWGHVIDVDQSSPMAINDPLLADLATLEFGDAFACGAQTAGGRVCWGDNGLCQLGDGMTGGNSPTPVLYADAVVSTSSRNQHSCALTPASQVVCWGYNGRGQCGQSGAMQQVATPAIVKGAGQPLAACTHVASGNSFSCAICGDAPWCWGDNGGYQLGRGDTMVGGFDEAADRVAVPQGTYTEVAAGLYHACAIAAGGALYCWGYGGHGELGDGSHGSNLPALIVPAAN